MTAVDIEVIGPDTDDESPLLLIQVHIMDPAGGVHASVSLSPDATDAEIADGIVRAAESAARVRGQHLPVALYARMRDDS